MFVFKESDKGLSGDGVRNIIDCSIVEIWEITIWSVRHKCLLDRAKA